MYIFIKCFFGTVCVTVDLPKAAEKIVCPLVLYKSENIVNGIPEKYPDLVWKTAA